MSLNIEKMAERKINPKYISQVKLHITMFNIKF